jgi:hypothetical protein
MSRIFEEFQDPAIQTKMVQHLCGFFHQIKVRQPMGRKDSIQTVCRKSRRLDSFLYEAAQNLSLFKYSRLKFKNKNPIAVDVIFTAYLMVPLS